MFHCFHSFYLLLVYFFTIYFEYMFTFFLCILLQISKKLPKREKHLKYKRMKEKNQELLVLSVKILDQILK